MITITRAPADLSRDSGEFGPAEQRPSPPALLWRLPLSAVVAVLVSLAVQWCLARVDLPHDSFVPEAVLNLACAVLLAGLLGLVALRRWPVGTGPLVWAGLSALATLPLGLLLRGTRFYLFGLGGDQLFRTQYLARLTDSAALADGNYAGLPPYYPAGWFWLGGRFANLLGLPAWEAYKPWALVTMAVAPVVGFVLWSAVVRRPVALLLAVLCCLVGLRVAAYEPYSWVLVVVVVPVAVLLHRDLDGWVAGRERAGRSALVLAGACLGVCAAVYTLLAFYCAAAVGSLVVWAAARKVRRGARPQVAISGAVARLLLVGLVAAPPALLVWGPFLAARAQLPAAPNPAARFLPQAGAEFPVPMLEFSVSGAICALGAGWVLWSWRRSHVAQALGLLIAGCYGWYAVSVLALSADTTLLAFRAEPVLLTCLFCAGGLAGAEIAERARDQWGAAAVRIALATGLAATLVLAQNIEPALEKSVTPGLVDQAYATYDDTGRRPSGVDTADGGAWNGELIATIDELTGRPPRDVVVLAADPDVLAFRPYRGFQVVSPAYANPLASYEKRRLLVESWARSRTPDELRAALDRSPFPPPSVFVFTRGAGSLRMTASRDTFPHDPGSEPYAVDFPAELFDSPGFSRRDVGPYAVITRN